VTDSQRKKIQEVKRQLGTAAWIGFAYGMTPQAMGLYLKRKLDALNRAGDYSAVEKRMVAHLARIEDTK